MNVRPFLGVLAGAAYLFSATPGAAGDDELTALLKHQSDIFSAAGQRGDQATVDSYLDDQVLFSGGDGTVGRDPKLDKTDDVSALLKRETQAFRDAGQRGDTATMRSYLDDQVTFINEDGVGYGRSDFQGGAPAAPPRGIPAKVTVTSWILHHSGDVAVSSFVDDQVVHYPGQILDYQFLSVETWIKRGAVWKLIGSGTIPLHQDPPAATLPASVLNDYAGTYSAGPGSAVTISQDGSTILSSSNGGKAAPLTAEFRDVFFRPGLPQGYARPRIIFQRDASGQVTGYLNGGVVLTKTPSAPPQSSPGPASSPPPPGPLVLRDFVVRHSGDIAVASFLHDRDTPYYGQDLHQTYRSIETWIKRGTAWKMITSQGRQMQPDPAAVTLSADALNDYVGSYAVGRSLSVTISRDGNALASSTNGAKPVALDAEARDVFFTPGSPRTSIIFQRDANGHVTGYLSRREERDLVFTKAS